MKIKLLFFALSAFICKVNFSQTLLVLKPGAAAGKDALIAGCIPCGYDNSNYGAHKDFLACAWTNGGNFSPARGLLEFDLSAIPVGSTILNASLSLFHYNSLSNPGHSTLSGPNTALLQRIIQPWGETTVTWNNQPAATSVNEVTLSASTSTNQNYTNINVTGLVQDMVNNPTQSFGFMFRQQTETIYRSMLFASSDLENPALWPELKVVYISALGIQESSLQNDLSVFPNPSNGVFTVRCGKEISRIEMYNCIGEKVLISQSADEIDASPFSKGVYFVKVFFENGTQFKKIVLE